MQDGRTELMKPKALSATKRAMKARPQSRFCKAIVDAHGGMIAVESGECGTTFTVRMPRQEARERERRYPRGRYGQTTRDMIWDEVFARFAF